jgi:hypothetical protein
VLTVNCIDSCGMPETALLLLLLRGRCRHQRIEAWGGELRNMRLHAGLDPPLTRRHSRAQVVNVGAAGFGDLQPARRWRWLCSSDSGGQHERGKKSRANLHHSESLSPVFLESITDIRPTIRIRRPVRQHPLGSINRARWRAEGPPIVTFARRRPSINLGSHQVGARDNGTARMTGADTCEGPLPTP